MKTFFLLIAAISAGFGAESGTIVSDIQPGKLYVGTVIECADRKYQALMTKDGLEVKSYTVINAAGSITKERAHGMVMDDQGMKITSDKGVKAGDQVTIGPEARKP